MFTAANLTIESRAQIALYAEQAFPSEACGFVVRTPEGAEIVLQEANLHPTPQEDFRMRASAMPEAEKQGTILCVWHTHPNASAEPSPADKTVCERTDLPWIIFAYPRKSWGACSPCGYKQPLLGRQFVHGVTDCYSLLRDYYKEKQIVDLPDFPREDLWWEVPGAESLYVKNFAACGFRRVGDNLKPHDALLFSIRASCSNHGAAYEGEGVIIHHLYGRLSERTMYGSYWQKHTTYHLRHESLC